MKELAKQVLRPVTPYIPDAIHQWWSDRHLKIDSDPALFAEFSEPLRPIMAKVASTRFYSYADERRITGWLSRRERQTLYALGRWIPGPIRSWIRLTAKCEISFSTASWFGGKK